MPTARWTRVVIGLAAGVWVLILVATGGSVDAAWAQLLGYAASVVVLLLLAFDRWIWCWPYVRRVVGRVSVRGTWRVELRSNYGPRKDEVVEAYLVIRQTYSDVSVVMLTERATSTSRGADLGCVDGRWTLAYWYTSTKHADAPDRATNPHARGAAELVVASAPVAHLEGDYFTEEGTTGRLRTTGHSTALFDTFATAPVADYT
jgi:hypothetical protein